MPFLKSSEWRKLIAKLLNCCFIESFFTIDEIKVASAIFSKQAQTSNETEKSDESEILENQFTFLKDEFLVPKSLEEQKANAKKNFQNFNIGNNPSKAKDIESIFSYCMKSIDINCEQIDFDISEQNEVTSNKVDDEKYYSYQQACIVQSKLRQVKSAIRRIK